MIAASTFFPIVLLIMFNNWGLSLDFEFKNIFKKGRNISFLIFAEGYWQGVFLVN